MRYVRFGLLTMAFGAVASAPALSLQWLTKWNPAQSLPTSFTKVAKVSSGYVIGGQAGRDAVLIKTDEFGNQLDIQFWDSPEIMDDSVGALEVDSAGRIYAVIVSRTNGPVRMLHLVQCDGSTLTPTWERSYAPVDSNFSSWAFALFPGASPQAYLAASSGSGAANRTAVYSVNSSGTAVFTTNLDDGNENVSLCAKAFPTASNGVAIGGGVDGRERITRVSSAGAVAWTALAAAPGVLNNQVTALDIDGTNVAGVGRHRVDNISPFRATAYRYNGIGLDRTVYASGTHAVDVKYNSGNQFVAVTTKASGYDLLNYDRSTAVITLRSSHASSNPSILRLNSSSNRLLMNGGGLLQTYDMSANSFLASGGPTNAAWADGVVAFSNFGAVGSDNANGRGMFRTAGTGFSSLTYYSANGYQLRTPVESVSDAAGARYVLSRSLDSQSEETTWVTKFSPSGAIAWIRQVLIGGDRQVDARAIAINETGDTLAVACQSSTNDLAVASLNPATGAISWGRKYAQIGVINQAADIKIEAGTGTIWVLTNTFDDGVDKEGVFRLGPSGALFSYSYLAPQLLFSGAQELHQMSADRWAMVSVGAGASFEGARVRFLNGGSTTTSTYDFDTSSSLPNAITGSRASNGDLVVGVPRSDGSLEVRRFDALSGLTVWSTSLTGSRGTIARVAALPGGGAYVASFRGADNTYRLDQVTAVGGAGWTSILAATVTGITDLEVDATDRAYFLGTEGTTPVNAYVARYLTNGVRSSQQRVAGTPVEVGISGSNTDVLGHLTVRNRGRQISLARYLNP